MTAQIKGLQAFKTASITVATQPCKFVRTVKYGTVKNVALASCLLDVCERIFAYQPRN